MHFYALARTFARAGCSSDLRHHFTFIALLFPCDAFLGAIPRKGRATGVTKMSFHYHQQNKNRSQKCFYYIKFHLEVYISAFLIIEQIYLLQDSEFAPQHSLMKHIKAGSRWNFQSANLVIASNGEIDHQFPSPDASLRMLRRPQIKAQPQNAQTNTHLIKIFGTGSIGFACCVYVRRPLDPLEHSLRQIYPRALIK
jgi:hypothetical protein